MSALHPSLHVVASRLEAGNAAKVADEGTVPAQSASTAGPGSANWASLPVPAALDAAFERAAQVRAQRSLAPAPGQLRALRQAPGFGAVLLDRWSPTGQCWHGWLATPDPAYATATDLVLEQRDGPLAPRMGMVCCMLRVRARADQLGACLGTLPARRVAAVRWLGETDRGAAAGCLSRPGLIARTEVPDGYALTGSPLAGHDDPRHAYRAILARGIERFGLETVPGVGNDANGSSAGSRDHVPAPRPVHTPAKVAPTSGNAAWVKPFAIVAATLAVAQSGLLLWRYHSDSDNAVAQARAGERPYPGGGDGSRFRVQFRAQATEAEIRAWLLQEKLQIIGGPDATAGFTLYADTAQRALPTPGPGNPLAKADPADP